MRKVSEYLREEREQQGLSLDDVARATKIKKNFLTAIENGKFYDLPSQAYAVGFVKNYANFLGLSESKVAAFFRREYLDERVNIVPEFRKNQHRFNKFLLFQPKRLLIFGAVVIIAAYIFFQYSSLFFGPRLTLESPKNGQTTSENVIEVKGTTDQYATVLVDGEEAYVGIDGRFKKSVYTFPGDKKITVIAKNRSGKETVQTVDIKVK